MFKAQMYFFFSSRRRHTSCSRDWSSDVCSSDLLAPALLKAREEPAPACVMRQQPGVQHVGVGHHDVPRSEERRVGKECESRWSPDLDKVEKRECTNIR